MVINIDLYQHEMNCNKLLTYNLGIVASP